MQKWRPRSLSHSLSATHIQPLSLTDFMDVHCLTFSLIEYTPHSCLVFIFFPFLPSFLSPFPLCRLLSGISSRLTSLAVTLDFKELLHSSVTHQRERSIQRCAKREGGDEEWVYKKKKKKRGWTSVWKEGSREKEDPLLTAGNLGSHKSKGGTHSHTSTHPYRVTLSTYTHFFCFVLLGVCRFTYMILSFFCLSIFCLSHLPFIPFTWAGSTKGVSRPVPSRNPSLHLDMCVCVCVFQSFLCYGHSLIFLNLALCIFITFVLTDILPLFFIPLCFEVAGELVFRSLGIAIASPLSWRLAHTQLHTNAHRYALFFVLFTTLSLGVVYTNMWLCGLVYTVAQLVKTHSLYVCQVTSHLSFVSL